MPGGQRLQTELPIPEVWPAKHAVQLSWPSLEKVPAGQGAHAALFEALKNVPAGQRAHAELPGREKVPVGQGRQTDGSDAPTTAEKDPAEQRLNSVAPKDVEYAPAGQEEQAEAPRLEKVPSAQTLHAVPPGCLPKVPAGQDAQLDAPWLEKVPFPQRVQTALETAPVSFEYVPAAQGAQAVVLDPKNPVQ